MPNFSVSSYFFGKSEFAYLFFLGKKLLIYLSVTYLDLLLGNSLCITSVSMKIKKSAFPLVTESRYFFKPNNRRLGIMATPTGRPGPHPYTPLDLRRPAPASWSVIVYRLSGPRCNLGRRIGSNTTALCITEAQE